MCDRYTQNEICKTNFGFNRAKDMAHFLKYVKYT